MKKLLILYILLLAIVFKVNAQRSAIIGMVIDNQGEPVIGAVAVIQLHQDTVIKCRSSTNEDGEYWIRKLNPGRL
jgi:hypothetical protein